VVMGVSQRDQDWIDDTVEAGVGACHWPRPQPRMSASPAAKPQPVIAKRHWWQRRSRKAAAPPKVAPKVEPASAPSPAPVLPPAVEAATPPVTSTPESIPAAAAPQEKSWWQFWKRAS
jgi:hypothetical protein